MLEVVLLLPVLVIATFSFFVLGPTVAVRQTVQHAAEETAREVAKSTGSQTTLGVTSQVIEQVLSVHGLDLDTPGVLVIVEQFDDVQSLGDESVTDIPITSSVTQPEQVIVTLLVTTDSAPIPNVLRSMNFEISGRTISHRATAFRDL
ncbi:TadE/TadG family type IV pilus assembly protein [Blastopirellula marina]|uniref:Pilus assembly protein TadE n=1 Tax=Blastopirellula marina TaxID=124 RepID=A0A2S8GCI4_9BACT|nr:TadE/TadG family type IV pilus assembly protein [Blastopirellula marina]PQO42157.1 hypothetical protein C5Y93_27820 [Blastopirellula marina]